MRCLASLFLVGSLILPVPIARANSGSDPARLDSVSVLPGTRVRVSTISSSRQLVGRFAGADSLSLRVEVAEGQPPAQLLRASVSRFEVSHGKLNRPIQGAVLGWSFGMVSGTLLGLALQDRRDCGPNCVSSDGVSPLMTGVAGAGIGLVVGLLVGSSMRRDQWVQAEIPPTTAP